MTNASLVTAANAVTKMNWHLMNTRPELTSDQCAELAVSTTCEMLNVDRAVLVAALEAEAA